ncbi:DNA mismatch repair protein MSH3 [Pseudocercospora fuligena]|uniref:DNA mismatch repair protein MSH3 n=1 Tax=Pseudocercospora fuligena TaxID=685502 RepID=A0A8H6VHD4_9PEZI|nr:DNA mismatch repair protein MSH3 [Pseudocercospora fuligena]
MVTAKAPSLTQQSSQSKKQQSISSFFTSTATQKPKVRDLRPSPTPRLETPPTTAADDSNALSISDDEDRLNGQRKASNASKRGIEESDETDVHQPDSKRRKSNDSRISLNARRESLGEVSMNGGKKPKATERTSKYAFGSSSSAATGVNQDVEDDEETRKLKERLHQKFVRKLGRPDSMANIKRRNGFITEETQAEEEGADDEDAEDEEHEPASKRGRKAPAPASRKAKLTLLEQRIVELKRKHSDALLVVEVGYKYRLFGEDARVAAKVLSVVCIPGKFRFDEHPSEAHMAKFASASFPTHRLHVHVKRLINAGHKVGIVRQLETAALKAAGANKSKLFERDLTNLYTKATYVDDEEGLGAPSGAVGGAPASGYLLCLTESYPKGVGSDEKVQIGLIAVQPATGDIIYDDFEDGWMRSELETRLLHISPAEFLIIGDVSKATDRLVQYLSGGDDARLERKPKPKTMAAQSYSHITKFYADKMKGDGPSSSQVESSQEKGTLLDRVHRLSENATICLSAMITHLTDYGLQHVFDLTKCFQSFSARSHMLLNGNTLSSLEIYRNQTDQAERGSLFWTLDRTQTKFGRRLLRKWVGRPLLDRARLDERTAAVEELREGMGTAGVARISQLLSRTRADLERTLIRIYYKRCARPELLAFLQNLQAIAQEYVHVQSAADAGFESAMINEAVASLPRISDDVLDYLGRMNLEAAKKNDKYNFFRDEHETEAITDHKVGIVAVEHDLNDFKTTAATILKRKFVSYVTVAEIDYLIELENTALKNVPATWTKISSTKKLSRFHPPEVVKLLRERDQHKESLSNACDTAFHSLLEEIGSKYTHFRECIQSLALLDCLLSLATVSQQPGYTKPNFTSTPGIKIEAGRHPMVEQLLLDQFVPNNVYLSSDATRALLITGPNMGGKSSYVRSVALIAIMAQIGSYVPAEACEMGLLDAVFTRMGAQDNMMKGESTFMVEVGETSDILKQATSRSLVILDELGRGTSTHDGVAIAQSVLHHVVAEQKCLTLFITHYQSLARLADSFDGELKNVHMRFEEKEGTEDITFLYEVGEGVAHRSYGLNVARLAGLPRSLLEQAGRKSKEMEEEEMRRKLKFLAKVMTGVMNSGDDGERERALEMLVGGVEEL